MSQCTSSVAPWAVQATGATETTQSQRIDLSCALDELQTGGVSEP